jgi:secreted trypsin-like serine protease
MRIRKAGVPVVGLALLLSPIPAAAEGNWARDHVRARVAAMAQHAGGPAPAPERGAATPEIVGGTDAPFGVHRFQVALLYGAFGSNRDSFYCGGTLVRQRYVITAAHCSDFVSAKDVRVLTGTQKLDGSGTRRRVRAIHIHPEWNSATFDYDVAVWDLGSTVPGMPPVNLAVSAPRVGVDLLVTGWGRVSESGPIAERLQQVTVPMVDPVNCNDANSYDGAITARMLCAGYDHGGRDSCSGDSGGPLTRLGPRGNRVLTGIVSWGTGCAQPDYFGVYTRVSAPSIRNFILHHIAPWPYLR